MSRVQPGGLTIADEVVHLALLARVLSRFGEKPYLVSDIWRDCIRHLEGQNQPGTHCLGFGRSSIIACSASIPMVARLNQDGGAQIVLVPVITARTSDEAGA